MSRSSWVHWSLLALSVFVVGCGKGELRVGAVPVSGLVLLDNQPAPGVTVSFSPDDPKVGRAAVGTTDSSGRFTLTTKVAGDGAVPGSYTVLITKTAATASGNVAWKDPRSTGGKLSDEDMKAVMEGMKGGPKSSATASDIPAKYASRDSSGLSATVAAGQTNDFTFAMTK